MRILKCIVLVTLLAQSNGFFINTLGNVAKTIVDTAGKVIGTAGKTAENLVETSVNTVGNVIDTGVKIAGNVVETVVHTGVDVFCAVVGVLVPCREVSGGSGYSAPLPIRCNALADIVFVVDASSSVGSVNFKKVLSLVANMVASFTFGASNVRFGLVVYSTEAQIWFNLDEYNVVYEVQKNILETPYDGGNTYTDRALNLISDTYMFENHAGGREDAPGIVVLITDGQSNNPTATLSAAKRLKDHDVTIFSVGITSSIKESELQGVASRAENVFKATDFDALAGILGLIVDKTCVASRGTKEVIQVSTPKTTAQPAPIAPACKTVADILYVIDSSGSIGPVNYNKLLQFTVDLTQNFKIGTADVLFAGVVFSHTAKKMFDLKDNPTQDSLKKALLNTQYMNSTTHTDLALDLVANQTMFSTASGGRSNARKIVIVLTDGLSSSPEKTQVSAARLKSRGIIIVSVGIGQAEDAELKGMASTADDVFKIASFDALSQIKQQVIQRACLKSR
ncbi:collagen alpha-6(VI) chain-like [Biomphalaria glabrata]|uniref:Collagen alpha-6(VI) chain-like n=1 Tax=Biomphalaria glabrata TaxID=6526 RepID=A0A9W2YCZ4_BIOGL|nr:collagen alpha-6(VI) chain-like [Biomphalaria glabrata]XP_055860644.1 collagen alpha-6(VI) chain-like [Biomphalaria glabrata]